MEEEKRICPICFTKSLKKFISFGKMPVANAFLKQEDLWKEEYMYDMEVGFCEDCKMVQMINIVPYDKYIVPDQQGKTNYAFFSSTSKFMEEHFAELTKEIETRFLERDSKVLEIGSNDGILLKSFKNNPVLGVEPSDNVAEIAKQLGVETITKFFDEELAKNIAREKGKFRTVVSTNVFLNIIDIHSCIRGIKTLLDEKGVFITEDPYIINILEQNAYDQIYDEHIWYFSLTSLSNLFKQYDMEIFDAEKQWVHGGSMRVYICNKGRYEKTDRLKKYLKIEEEKGIASIIPYLEFRENVEESKRKLKELVSKLKSEGKKIVGYAAASKGTIVFNYCDIGSDIVEYISDSTPFKQGLYSPGKHIPIVSPDFFQKDNADYAILSAWNHAKEITEKEKEFITRGGRFIVHLPTPRIVEPEPELFEGIKTKLLKIFANEQGHLFETVRADDSLYDGKFGQTLVSVLYPGVIKGLHKHKEQTDYTTCISGEIKYVVVKEKENGEFAIKTFIIGRENPILIKTPPGFWHGYMPLKGKEAIVLHMMDKTFDVNNDDTERRDPFYYGNVWGEEKIKKVVASGYFDPYHEGHAEYLRLAKEIAGKNGKLIVILNNDEQLMLKRARDPEMKKKVFMPLSSRMEVLKSIGAVDEVFISIDHDESVCKSLEILKPDIFAKGGDRYAYEVPESEVCKKYNIQIIDGLGEKRQASSELIKRVSS